MDVAKNREVIESKEPKALKILNSQLRIDEVDKNIEKVYFVSDDRDNGVTLIIEGNIFSKFPFTASFYRKGDVYSVRPLMREAIELSKVSFFKMLSAYLPALDLADQELVCKAFGIDVSEKVAAPLAPEVSIGKAAIRTEASHVLES